MVKKSAKADLQSSLELCHLIIDNIHNGVIVTDAEGKIIFFNKPYGRFLGIDPAAQIGKHATEVIENTRMHIVAKTGMLEINKAHRLKNQDMVVQRIPIKKDGKVIAVFGQVMFKDVSDVQKLADRLCLLESKVKLYEEEIFSLRSTRYTFDSIIAESQVMERLKKEALKAAATALPILITGESGTGKEMFAQAIHHASNRRVHPFVRINCASIPRELLEAELFGYEKGAFTGARTTGKPGKFELANQGSIFLDEIGDMPLEMQPKLLRVLEEKEFERVGGIAPVRSDFRLIAATNNILAEKVAQGLFRADLYYRLKGIPLVIPPLRERREDIILLARTLLKQMLKDSFAPEISLSSEAANVLLTYDWPGNVREMNNVLGQILATIEGDVIERDDLPFYLRKQYGTGRLQSSGRILGEELALTEQKTIRQALELSHGNKSQAARRLGIHRTLLYKKMKRHGMGVQGDGQ
ncbi:MAG: sigma 54-interacting transcriptional regulator [Deltaproteobacteria bacterium]|nr:sigma 54-interacting transcriptional regulator [Deltaproteobacteria bacterium]